MEKYQQSGHYYQPQFPVRVLPGMLWDVMIAIKPRHVYLN
jgi:hypothetical protein